MRKFVKGINKHIPRSYKGVYRRFMREGKTPAISMKRLQPCVHYAHLHMIVHTRACFMLNSMWHCIIAEHELHPNAPEAYNAHAFYTYCKDYSYRARTLTANA